jgi:hypothetical protein
VRRATSGTGVGLAGYRGMVIGICIWIIDLMPMIPPTFKAVAKAIILVVGLLIVLLHFLPMAGVGRL